MSDDSFFREVSEELRQDRVRALWTRFGKLVVAAMVAVILATAAYVAWDYYETERMNAEGDRFIAASELAAQGKRDEAVPALQAIVDEGSGAYPVLARMRLAAVFEDQAEPAKAVAEYDAVSQDSSAPQPLRNMARVRAGYILVDSGSLADVRQRIEVLTADAEPLRYPAREALALASWKAGQADDARNLFQQLLDDRGTPRGIADRARLMLDVLAAGDADDADASGEAAAGEAAGAAGEADAAPTPATPPEDAAPAAGMTAAPTAEPAEPAVAEPTAAPDDADQPAEPAASQEPAAGNPASDGPSTEASSTPATQLQDEATTPDPAPAEPGPAAPAQQ